MKMNIAHIESESYIYAPGKQYVIWMQGCSIHCKGCWNSEMWSFNKVKLIEIDEIIENINKIPDLIGVTFLGGEPFDQPEVLLSLINEIKKNKFGITIYTGYQQDELKDKTQNEIFKKTDLLISGRFIEEMRNTNLQWIGSENQKIIYLTEFYKDTKIDNANYCEINISGNGQITLLGFPDENLIKELN